MTATSIQNTPIGTTTRNVGNFTDVDANGNVTLGNAVADVITVNGTTTFANGVTGNGAVTLGNGNDNITLNAGSGIISASGDKLENVADPTAAQDAATKNYVDNGFVRLGPPALQSYSGTQPLIRLDETGAGAPNLMDLRVAGVATFGVTNNGTIRVGTTTSSTNSRMTIRDGHLQSQQTTAPTTGTLGTGVVSAVLTNATDVAGIITIATNATPATGAQATVTFNLPYGIAPIVVLTPANGNASGIVNHATRTAAGFTVNFNAAPAASTSYQFYYHVIETQ
ncbi:MAG: hypothetical protein JNJ94_02855 [Chlorobi bacterium]|nr:hypothetical protein [Chlorobiota bacterium]